MTRDTVGTIVVDYLNTGSRENPFNGQPGQKWWKDFLHRFPELVDWKAQHLPKRQAIAGNAVTIQGFGGSGKGVCCQMRKFTLHQ